MIISMRRFPYGLKKSNYNQMKDQTLLFFFFIHPFSIPLQPYGAKKTPCKGFRSPSMNHRPVGIPSLMLKGVGLDYSTIISGARK